MSGMYVLEKKTAKDFHESLSENSVVPPTRLDDDDDDDDDAFIHSFNHFLVLILIFPVYFANYHNLSWSVCFQVHSNQMNPYRL